jgi:hypothetical protein
MSIELYLLLYPVIGVLWGRVFCSLVSGNHTDPEYSAFWISVFAWPLTFGLFTVAAVYGFVEDHPGIVCKRPPKRKRMELKRAKLAEEVAELERKLEL